MRSSFDELNQFTQSASQFMKHSKRRRLTSEDFNKALGTSSTEVKLKLKSCFYFLYLCKLDTADVRNPGPGGGAAVRGGLTL